MFISPEEIKFMTESRRRSSAPLGKVQTPASNLQVSPSHIKEHINFVFTDLGINS